VRAANDIARIIDLVTEGWCLRFFFFLFSFPLSFSRRSVSWCHAAWPFSPSDRVFFLGPTVNRIFHRHNPVQSSQQPPPVVEPTPEPTTPKTSKFWRNSRQTTAAPATLRPTAVCLFRPPVARRQPRNK
jgi:hypothetical protein